MGRERGVGAPEGVEVEEAEGFTLGLPNEMDIGFDIVGAGRRGSRRGNYESWCMSGRSIACSLERNQNIDGGCVMLPISRA